MTAAASDREARPSPDPVVATQLLFGRTLWIVSDVVDAIALVIADLGELLNRVGHRIYSAGCDRCERNEARR